MKLNNRGWGLGFLITIGTIFIIILIAVSIGIRSMTHQLKDDKKDSKSSDSTTTTTNNSLYELLEASLQKAGESYTNYHPTMVENTEDHLIIKYDTLKNEGFIETLKDPNNDGDCAGYVFIKHDYSVQSFIKCKDYTTTNYELWVD